LQVENKPSDVNRPVYPGSPRPHTGAKHWKPDSTCLGDWGRETFRRWIPKKVGALRTKPAHEACARSRGDERSARVSAHGPLLTSTLLTPPPAQIEKSDWERQEKAQVRLE